MRWLARLVLLRVLPRRLIPILTVWEVWKLVRGRQEARDARRNARSATPGPATRRPPTR
ncbi:MAG TPA: hypothetical protein VH723_10065 [Candidatus Limnocylindrales bacterium]